MNDIQNNTDLFEVELHSTGRAGIEEMIKAVHKSGFYLVGGSGGHDREKGGTLNHSLWVLFVAREELKKHPNKYSGVKDDSLTLVCLLHDLGNTSPSVAYHRYSGHGRRSALIADRVKRHHGLDISDVELSAIRFHRAHHVVDDFDRRLDLYSNSPLIKLLKYADWTAAGVFNCVPFGSQKHNYILEDRRTSVCEVTYAPSTKYWLLDTRVNSDNLYKSRSGVVDLSSLTKRERVLIIYSVQLYGAMSTYDLLLLRDKTGELAIMTSVIDYDDRGVLYRSDGHGFSYRRAILYFHDRGGHYAPAYYIAAENHHGEWSMIEITPGFRLKKQFQEQDQRHLIAQNCKSEAEAVRAVRNRHHGVDLKNGYFIRIPI